MTNERHPGDWARRAAAWCEGHPPPIGAPMGSRTPRNAEEHREWVEWTRAVHAAGFPQMAWPQDHGGAGADRASCLAVDRVLAAAGAPIPLSDIGVSLVAPAIWSYGTTQQQHEHLPGIAAGTTIWAQLFSEPGAGSDLAALRVRAEPGGHGAWVINGQKTWNTYAHIASWGFLLARTGTLDSRHKGLSVFLVPMDRQGIEVRPLQEMTGTRDFNEVFFDQVLLEADHLLGAPNQGWEICVALLEQERHTAGRHIAALEGELGRLIEVMGSREGDESSAVRLGQLLAQAQGVLALLEADDEDEADPPAAKISYSELNVMVHQLAIDIIATAPEHVPPLWAERWRDNFLYARAYTIAGGANEVLRNVIAKRVLKLPT